MEAELRADSLSSIAQPGLVPGLVRVRPAPVPTLQAPTESLCQSRAPALGVRVTGHRGRRAKAPMDGGVCGP